VNTAQVDALRSELDVIEQELENLEHEERTARSEASHALTPEQVSGCV